VTDQSVTPVAELLLECLRQAVADLGDAAPKLVGMRPGLQVDLLMSTYLDECCQGLAWLRLASMYPSDNFPAPDQEASRCGPLRWAAVFELGIARCAPTPPANMLVTPQQWTTAQLAVFDDSAALRRTLCCFGGAERDRLTVAGAWTPLPTAGGCLGGTQLVTVAIDECDCTDEEVVS
jgi:hypothetical protein